MTLHVEEVPALRGYAVEWADGDDLLLSRRNTLLRARGPHPPFTPVATIDAPRWRQAASRVRLLQRLLRFMVTNVVPLPDGDLFVTFDAAVGLVRDGEFLPVTGLVRPCRVLRGSCAVLPDGDVYFGEYRLNTERHEMHVYRLPAGATAVEIAHTFPAGSVAHVHGMYLDGVTGAMYCLTGDDAAECQILRTFDGCASFEVVGDRDETWRAVSISFGDDSLLYGTDASFRANHIYRTDRTTMQRTILGEVDGPVLFSRQLGDDHIFCTSAEAAESQADDVASLWQVTEAGDCRRLISYRKDRWPHTLFKLGTIHFPTVNTSNDELWFHLVAVQGDNRTFRLRRG